MRIFNFHYESFLKHQKFCVLSNDWKGCSLERTVLHPLPNSSKIHRFTDGGGCRQIGYADDMLHLRRLLFFVVVAMPVYLRWKTFIEKQPRFPVGKRFLRHEAYFLVCKWFKMLLFGERIWQIYRFINPKCFYWLQVSAGKASRPIVGKRFRGSQRCFTRILQCLSSVSKKYIAVFQVAAQYFLKGVPAKECLEETGSCQ